MMVIEAKMKKKEGRSIQVRNDQTWQLYVPLEAGPWRTHSNLVPARFL